MSNPKTTILEEFDSLISELKALVAQIPDYSQDRSNRGITEYISTENREKFIDLRARCLLLLNQIDSKDVKLKEAIDFIRDIDILLWNIKKMLEQMQSLRAEFAADLLSQHPRLQNPYTQSPEKKGWLNENRTKIVIAIIVAIIGVFGTVAVHIADELLKRNEQNSISITFTPTLSQTSTVTRSSTPPPTP